MTLHDSVSTKFKLHQRVYLKERPLSRSELGLEEQSWVWAAIQHEAARSKLKPSQDSEVRAALSVFGAMASFPTWTQVANTPATQLELDDVLLVFEAIEETIGAWSSWGAHSKSNASMRCRAMLTRFLEDAGFAKARRLSLYYRARLTTNRALHTRKLISDIPITTDGVKHEPVGAIRHGTPAELQQQTIATLQRDLDRIRLVSKGVLDAVDAARNELDVISQSGAYERLITQIAAVRTRVREPAWLSTVPIERLAGSYITIARRSVEQIPGSELVWFRAREIAEYLNDKYSVLTRSTRALYFPLGLCADVRTACLLLLQVHTGWNVNTVLAMTTDSLSSRTPPLQIQSFKDRVNQQSDIVPVDRRDVDVLRVLDLLHARLDLMKKLRKVEPGEKRLWLNDLSTNGSPPQPYVGWGSALRNFQDKHGLPHFSLEQVRTQVIALSGEQGGHEEARRKANHRSLATTGASYTFKLLLRRKNEAVNLEFQRRIEEQIVYREDVPPSSAGYLWPIGDGSSCSDPQDPPFEHYLDSGHCSGKHCHQGDGCPNRKIEIDEKRIEEAVRTSAYYRANWNRLLNENREAFETYHLPSMVFNHALVGVIAQGRYGFAVRKAKEQFDQEQSGDSKT